MHSSSLTIPNMITLARFVAVPAVIYFMLAGQWVWAFWLFVLAGVSDGLDGFIARQFNQKSEIGAYLDPVADKLLLVATFIILAYEGILPLWLVLLFVARDVFIVGGVLLASLLGNEMTIHPLMVSKATTLFQIILAAWAFAARAYGFEMALTGDLLMAAATGLTLASAGAYANVWFRHMSGEEE